MGVAYPWHALHEDIEFAIYPVGAIVSDDSLVTKVLEQL